MSYQIIVIVYGSLSAPFWQPGLLGCTCGIRRFRGRYKVTAIARMRAKCDVAASILAPLSPNTLEYRSEVRVLRGTKGELK